MRADRFFVAITVCLIAVRAHPMENAEHEVRQVVSESILALDATPRTVSLTTGVTSDLVATSTLSTIYTADISVTTSLFDSVTSPSISSISTIATDFSNTTSVNNTTTTTTTTSNLPSLTTSASPTASSEPPVGGSPPTSSPGFPTGINTPAAIAGSIGGAAVIAVMIWWCLPARKQRDRSKQVHNEYGRGASRPKEKPTDMRRATSIDRKNTASPRQPSAGPMDHGSEDLSSVAAAQ